MTDNEIVKACKDCLHYEACKGTYSSAKGDEDILYDFDGEMYANSGCEDFQDKNLINRQKARIQQLELKVEARNKVLQGKIAENERLKTERDKEHDYANHYARMCVKAKTKAYKECIEKAKEKLRRSPQWICQRENCTNFGFSYDDVFNALDNLLKELGG